jgi:hypothetical protein
MAIDEMMCHKKTRDGPRRGTRSWARSTLSTAHEASGIHILFGRTQVKESSFDLIQRCQNAFSDMPELGS